MNKIAQYTNILAKAAVNQLLLIEKMEVEAFENYSIHTANGFQYIREFWAFY